MGLWLVSLPYYPKVGSSNHGAGKNESLEIRIFYHLEISTKPAVGSFQYCQPAQNQPESQILYHKNGSHRDLCVMTLLLHAAATAAAYKWFCTFPSP